MPKSANFRGMVCFHEKAARVAQYSWQQFEDAGQVSVDALQSSEVPSVGLRSNYGATANYKTAQRITKIVRCRINFEILILTLR